MESLLFDSLRIAILIVPAAILWAIARKLALHRVPGWNFIVAGVAFLIFGSLIGLLTNFLVLDGAVVAGLTVKEILEFFIGNFVGFLLMVVGLLKWLPHIMSARRSRPTGADAEESLWIPGAEIVRLQRQLERQVERRKRAVQILRASQSRFAYALRIARLGNWEWDIAADTLYWSREMYRIYGQSKSFNPTHEKFLKRVHPVDRERVQQAIRQALDHRKPYGLDYRIVRPDGRVRIVHDQATATSDDGGRSLRMAGVTQDITEQRLAENALRRSERNLRALADGANDGILVSVKGRIVFANRRIAEMLGVAVPDLFDKTVSELVHAEDEAGFKERLDQITLDENMSWTHETRFARRDGTSVPVEVNAANTLWYDKIASVFVVRDISLRKQAETTLAREKQRAEGTMASLNDGVITTGIDGVVDYVNPVAERLTGWSNVEARGQPLVKVLNLVDPATHEAAESPAARCQREGRVWCVQPFALLLHRDGQEHAVELSATPIHDTSRRALGVVIVFHEAPSSPAMAKGRPAVSLGTRTAPPMAVMPSNGDGGPSRVDAEWVPRITRALEDKRFLIYYQPILPLSERATRENFFEILLRMLDEQGRLVAPTAFLQAAERNNLMPTIDRWVIRSAFQALRTDSPAFAGGDILCAINVSGQSLGDPRFLDFVTEQLIRTGNDPRRICFQIAESAVVANPSGTMQFVSALHDEGCRFALDDVGIGQISFAYFRNLRADYLKIPGDYVHGMINDTFDSIMVESFNQVGHNLGLQTVAKGVEDHVLLERLRRLGVDYAQGYGVAKPAALERAIG